MARGRYYPLNSMEVKILNVLVNELSENGARQALGGMVDILKEKNFVSRESFERILRDARVYTKTKE